MYVLVPQVPARYRLNMEMDMNEHLQSVGIRERAGRRGARGWDGIFNVKWEGKRWFTGVTGMKLVARQHTNSIQTSLDSYQFGWAIHRSYHLLSFILHGNIYPNDVYPIPEPKAKYGAVRCGAGGAAPAGDYFERIYCGEEQRVCKIHHLLVVLLPRPVLRSVVSDQ